ETPPLLKATASKDCSATAEETTRDCERTRQMLIGLIGAKEGNDMPARVRSGLKRIALDRVVPCLAVCIVALVIALVVKTPYDAALALAATAGATGAALGSLLKLRDDLTRGAQMREFTTFLFGQVLLGVIAGLLVFIVDQAAIVNVPGMSMGIAAVSF